MATQNPRVWFKSISLENVRSFGTKQTINFTDKDGNAARWNVILGDNGTGKTTVLKALVIMIQNQRYLIEPGIDHYSLARNNGVEKGSIEGYIEKQNEVIKTGFTFESSAQYVLHMAQFTRNYEIEILTFAYGAARKIGQQTAIEERSKPFATLFDESLSLTNAEEWLKDAKLSAVTDSQYADRFDIILTILKTLFKEEVSDITIRIESGTPKVYFKTHYGNVRLHELSLGYKTLIAWMVDFAKGLLDRYPDSKDPLAEPAVCLVDELDLHLHPKFQRTIIQFLTETFPNTQFIVTAHSPLIVQSAEDANIIVLRREGNETVVESDRVNVHDWRIDQILSSDLFGGISSRAPQVEEKMSRRRSLLRKDERSPDEQHELDNLEKELGELPVMETREALKAIDIISKAIINEGQP